jgi:hypothetical protein
MEFHRQRLESINQEHKVISGFMLDPQALLPCPNGKILSTVFSYVIASIFLRFSG